MLHPAGRALHVIRRVLGSAIGFAEIEEGAMAKTRGTGLLMVWTDIDPEFEAEFNRWYDEEHLPRMLSMCRAFQCRAL